jgi:uridine kinase
MPAGLDGNPNPVVSPQRTILLERAAAALSGLAVERTLLVGIDGASATGKSTFADELARTLAPWGQPVVRASIDSFHRPRAERWTRGPLSPEGYYLDSHDIDRLRRVLLDPFEAGTGIYVPAVFDEPSDSPVDHEPEPVPERGILLFDGLFLHRPELVDYWHQSIFLTADTRRDQLWRSFFERDLPEDPAEREAELERKRTIANRYIEGQAIYERAASPAERATYVIDNDDFSQPVILGGPDESATPDRSPPS